MHVKNSSLVGTGVTSLWRSGPMETQYVIQNFADEEQEPLFGLSPSGDVVVRKALDHETQRVHKIIVVNQTLATPPLVDYMTISVVVSK